MSTRKFRAPSVTLSRSAHVKPPLTLELDEKRFSNMAKRLRDALSNPGLSDRLQKDGKVPLTWARTFLSTAMGYTSVNALQALLEGTSAGPDTQTVVKVPAASETDAEALLLSLIGLVNPAIQPNYAAPSDDEFPRVRFVRAEGDYDPEIESNLLWLHEGVWTDGWNIDSDWVNTFENVDGRPVHDDGSPLAGTRIDLPSGAVVQRILTLFAMSGVFNMWGGTKGMRHLNNMEPDPDSILLNGIGFQIEDKDRLDLRFFFSGRSNTNEDLPEGVKRIHGQVGVELARETGFPLKRRMPDGVIVPIALQEAERLLAWFSDADLPADYREALPNGGDDIFVEVRAG